MDAFVGKEIAVASSSSYKTTNPVSVRPHISVSLNFNCLLNDVLSPNAVTLGVRSLTYELVGGGRDTQFSPENLPSLYSLLSPSKTATDFT